MRHKINNATKRIRAKFGMSDYYRYFRYYFDFYLTPQPDFDFLEEASELYIPVLEVEEYLSSLQGNQSFCVLLVGHTGIGKSTILRNYFDVLRHKPKIDPDTGEIIIPYFCNNHGCNNHGVQDTACVFFASGIQYVADELIKRLEEPFNRVNLWDFIDNNKPTSFTRYRKGEFHSKEEDLEILLENDQFAYSAFLLKYLLSQKVNSCFSNVVILFDDVEGLDSSEIRRKYIDFAYHAYSCLKNKDGSWHVKLLIAERPYTRREFHKRDWQDQKPDINILMPVSLKELFQARHSHVVSKTEPKAIKRESWEASFEFLNQVLDKIDVHGKELLLSLSNFNVRKAFRKLEHCLSKGSWFQTTLPGSQAFKIDDNTVSIRITNPLLLKALGYGERDTYYETEDIVCIPNLMKNKYQEDSDICGLLVIKWFYESVETDSPFRISNQKRIEDFFEDIKAIFPLESENLIPYCKDVIKHFVKYQILEKRRSHLDEEEVLYNLMPISIALWEEFEKSSVLLELYREDIWLPQHNHRSVSPSLSLEPDEKIIECLLICKNILSKEEKLHRSLVLDKQRQQYMAVFGNNLISHHLIDGICASIKRTLVPNPPPRVAKLYDEIFKRISSLEEGLNNEI